MEPFDLSLQQVNFESDQLHLAQDLDSFSNVVNYDSQLIDTKSEWEGLPIKTFDVDPHYNLLHGYPLKTHNYVPPAYTSSTTAPSTVSSSPYESHLINPEITVTQLCSGEPVRTKENQDIRTLIQIARNTTAARRHLGRRKQIAMPTGRENLPKGLGADAPDGASAVALLDPSSFDTVAEALHLQSSVIGNKDITPAPAEVVAQIIADAERKYKEKMRVPAVNDHPPQTASPGAHAKEVHQNSNDQTQLVTRNLVQSEPTDASPELIRIPAQNITRTTERSSWFGTSKDKTLSQEAKIASKATNEEGKLKVSVSDSSATMGRNSVEEACLESASQNNDDSQSVSSLASDLDTDIQIQLETEAFLKSLPPIKPIDLSIFNPPSRPVRTSPHVRDYGSKPKQVSKRIAADDSGISRSSGENADVAASRVESGTVSVEWNERQLTSSTPKKFPQTQYVVPTYGPLFQRSSKQKTQTLPKKSASKAGGSAEMDQILKEKAKLEGQLEMLTTESQSALQERAELQAQVASLKLKLMSSKGKGIDAEKEGLKTDIEVMRQSRLTLEQTMLEAQRFLDEKLSECKNLHEELQQSQEAVDKVNMQTRELRDQLRTKDMTVQALKNKVAELYVDVQTSMQAKMQSDTEASSAKGDLIALVNSKDWYQKQLQTAHQARSGLQRELTIMQAKTVSQTSNIERLKTENARLRLQVAEAQQKALKEKELLATHLETIEADMLDREAAFQEIQREKNMMEDSFFSKVQSVEDERSKLSMLIRNTAELEAQLDKVQTELKRKLSQILNLETEQVEVKAKLALSEDSMMQKERDIEDTEQKLIEVENLLKAFQTSMGHKDMEILKLREEKAKSEISLNAALQEKGTVDKVLQSLKGDMGKVEKSFKQMRHELISKDAEIEKIKSEKASSDEKFEHGRKELSNMQINSEQYQKAVDDRSSLVDELKSHNVTLEHDVVSLKSSLLTLQVSNADMNNANEALVSELVPSKERLALLEQELRILAEKNVELENQPNLKELDDAAMKENLLLMKKIAEVEKHTHREVTKQKAKVAKVNVALKAVQSELMDRQKSFDVNVESMSVKLREMMTDKEKLETELEMLQRRYNLSMLEQQDQLQAEMQTLASELEDVRLQKQTLEANLFEIQRVKELEIEQYRLQLSALDQELLEVKDNLPDNNVEELNQKLELELEKERGRLAGLMQSNSTLKEHTSSLEEALARRESSLIELQTHIQDTMRGKEVEEHEYIKRIQALEDGLKKEKDGHRDLRKQIGSKISENKRMKRQHEAARLEHEQTKQDQNASQQELFALRGDLETHRQTELGYQTALKNKETESKTIALEFDCLKRELSDSAAKDPIMQEHIQTIQWQLTQKCRELEAGHEQMQLSEQRQLVEIDNVRKTMQATQLELESMRGDLNVARQEKLDLQAKVAELRNALKTSVHHHKLTKKLKSSHLSSSNDLPSDSIMDDPLPILIDVEALEQLLQDTAVKALESKPLDTLQSCLSSLRSEISGLQRQMDTHTIAVETTGESWRAVETQVQELCEVVKTVSNTSNATTSKSTFTVAEGSLSTQEKTQSLAIDGLIEI